MRRYAFNDRIDKIEKYYSDVVIIGSGLAGLYTALSLDEKLSCAMLSKAGMETGSSWLAQGGIAAAIQEEDSADLHYHDTLIAGAGLCNKEAVKILVEEGPHEIHRLLSMGVQFDITGSGEFHVTREGGHTLNRILHSGGDATGRGIVSKLSQLSRSKNNITMQENTFLVDILTSGERAVGVLAYNGRYMVFMAPNIVICSGGIGQVFRYTTNPSEATGDGVAAAIRAGVQVKDMEFVQFHPTALFASQEQEQSFLISEAVRGEGGVLRNQRGERFMTAVHSLADLAPRDIVSRAIVNEMAKQSTNHVYLDITARSKQYLVSRFPNIYRQCERYGIDMSSQWIPVCSVQHYFMGGIKTDLYGTAGIPGLYACGETACTGVHGANRLASNSLLECLVFGRRCAKHINESYNAQSSSWPDLYQKDCNNRVHIKDIRNNIKDIMMKSVGIIRNQKGLQDASNKLAEFRMLFEEAYLSDFDQVEAYNMVIIAQQIVGAALQRKQSAGAHFREN